MRRTSTKLTGAAILALAAAGANATLIDLGECNGANACIIENDIDNLPNPVAPNPSDGILLAWDEVQNSLLAQDLRVDRVFDSTAPFIEDAGRGDFLIKAGTVVSSHYLQWDPGNFSRGRVSTTITLDSQIFAFITADQNLFDSDFLGLPALDYNDFGFRGLEGSDTTVFNGEAADINWGAANPGDWTRLITAFSPGGGDGDDDDGDVIPVPEPVSVALLSIGLVAVGLLRRRKVV